MSKQFLNLHSTLLTFTLFQKNIIQSEKTCCQPLNVAKFQKILFKWKDFQICQPLNVAKCQKTFLNLFSASANLYSLSKDIIRVY